MDVKELLAQRDQLCTMFQQNVMDEGTYQRLASGLQQRIDKYYLNKNKDLPLDVRIRKNRLYIARLDTRISKPVSYTHLTLPTIYSV